MSSVMPMQFVDMVREELVIVDLPASSREQALRDMAQILVDKELCAPTFPKAIIERERVHPSGLPMAGHKIAIPHTDPDHVYESVILFARLASPVSFAMMGAPRETAPVRLISMFALKEYDLVGDVLETLIAVFQDNSLLDRLINAPTAASVHRILVEGVRSVQSTRPEGRVS